jgi:flagellar hook-associated protein 3 FlgL
MISAANETLSESDRMAISYEVTELKEQLLSLANTQVSGSFVFGGYKTGTEPFNAAGVYQGDSGQRSVEVAPGLTVKMNVPGDDIFSPTGGVNIFTVLSDFETNLQNNDADAIQDSIGVVATAHKQLINAQSTAGINLKTVLSGKELRDEIEVNVLQQREAVVDADPHEAFTNFTETQYGLQAALAQAQKIISSLDSGLR